MRVGSRIFKTLIRAFACMGIFWFFLGGSIATKPSNAASSSVETLPIVDFRQWKLLEREKHDVYRNVNFNYVSKRRVPNGPDPIHNRRADRTRQPPNRR